MFISVDQWFKICTHLLRSAPGPTLCGRNAAPPRNPFLSFCKKNLRRIRVPSCPFVVPKSRTCCAPRLDSSCAAGMPPLRSSPGKRQLRFTRCTQSKALRAECRSPPTRGRWALRGGAFSSHRMPFTTDTRSVGSVKNISAPRLDSTYAAGMPPLRVTPSFPSVKQTCVPIRVHPWFQNPAPVALRAPTPSCAAGMPPLRVPPSFPFPSFPSVIKPA